MSKKISAGKGERIVIIGAGPAGLGCAFELFKASIKNKVYILDKNSYPGGLARSYRFKNHNFDVGPHRFYTKNSEVLALWQKILGKKFIEVNRLTRVMYKDKLFLYPIELKDVITKLDISDSFFSLVSYIQSKIFLRSHQPKSFEDWVVKSFGRRLYQIFFKTYTEKVWGIPCNKIGAEWAAQRIKNLNFYEIVKKAILGDKRNKVKSLVSKFYYPKNGSGMMYQQMLDKILKQRNFVYYKESKVTQVLRSGYRVKNVTYAVAGKIKLQPVDFLLSSMPLTDLIFALYPKPPREVLEAARKLKYRDHITVNLLIKQSEIFKDNWIYIHSPEVKMARVTNYNNFRNDQKRSITNAISIEYFCFKNESLWGKNDQYLIDLALKELKQTGLINNETVLVDGFVIREADSYPAYYMGFQKHFNTVKNYVSKFTNLELIGRGGMYKYDNMDHALYTGMLGARNYLNPSKPYDTWSVNEDAEYLEESRILTDKNPVL